MANNHSITDFITNFGGGTRINRFKVSGSLPVGVGGNNNPTLVASTTNILSDFHIRAASLPSSQVGVVPINYRGRTVNYPGDRIYQPWVMTVLDDVKLINGNKISLYRAFHEWQERINRHVDNTTVFEKANDTDPAQHFASDTRSVGGNVWTVEQLDTNGSNTIRKFELWNCWPVAVGPIELDMSQDNTLSTFSVTLVYSHFRIDFTPNVQTFI
jgi:hypothetical protein